MKLVETKRTYTRLWTHDDLDNLKMLFCDHEMMKFLGGPLTNEQLNGALKFFLDHYDKHGFGPCAFLEKTSKNLIGILGLKYLPYSENIDLGFSVIKSQWHQGYGTEIAKAGLDYGFNILNQNKIDAICYPENKYSIRILEKIGMEFEKEIFFRGVNQLVYTKKLC